MKEYFMYYFIEILYLITVVTSLRLTIGGDVYLDAEGETHYKVKAETVYKEESSDERQHGRRLSKALRTGTSLDSSESSSDDGSKEIPVTTTTERTTTKKRKKKRNSIRTTSFTTKYERGTTRGYKESLKRHHHRLRHGKKGKTVLAHAHRLTLSTWPTSPDFDLESEEKPTIQPGDVFYSQHHHHYANNWFEEINNKSKELINKFNHTTNTWSEAIKNQTQQFGDNFNQFTNQTDKWQEKVENKTAPIANQIDEWKQVVENKTQQIGETISAIGTEANKTMEGIEDKIKEYNKDVQNWQEQMKNKTTQELANNELINHTSHWHHYMKNKTHQIGDIVNELGDQTNVLQEAKDKEKELKDKFNEFSDLTKNYKHHNSHHWGNKLNKHGNEANKWFDHTKDKQKEMENKLKELGNQANKLLDKKEEFLNKTNEFAYQAFNWHIHVKNKTTGFVDTLNEAAEQAHHLQQQLNNHVNGSDNKIKDYLSIAAFTKHVLTRTLRLIDKVEMESDEYHWRKNFKHLAKNYENKFKEFLRTIGQQQIKTRLGKQKVVLNTIDMSKHIVDRLVNTMIHEIEKKGLRIGSTKKIFLTEIRKEVSAEMKHACLTLGVCLIESGFTKTMIDLLIHMLMLDEEKFKQAFGSFTEATKNTDFSRSLGVRHDRGLKRKIALVEDLDVSLQRTIVIIIKNIVTNRNKPIVLTNDINPEKCNLNGTLAFLDVIDTLEKNIPDNDINVKKFYDIRTGMLGWAQGYNMQDTMTKFLSLTRLTLDGLNGKFYKVIRRSAKILFD